MSATRAAEVRSSFGESHSDYEAKLDHKNTSFEAELTGNDSRWINPGTLIVLLSAIGFMLWITIIWFTLIHL